MRDWRRRRHARGGVRSADTLAAGTSVCTWRAQSSPRHACGLNVSFFLHSLQVLRRGPGWACSGIDGGEKACGSLQGWAVLRGWLERDLGAILRGGSGKGLVFEKVCPEAMEGLYLLGLRTNFGGLVMVRFEVSKS